MKKWYSILKCTLAVFAMVLIILDTKTAINGISDGIELCIRSIIPALFPFAILSKLITTSAVGRPNKLLRPIGKICGIPSGSESIFILSFVGGYPFGAQCINDAYRNEIISRRDACRMVGFCNNAGPAFIFGILGIMFERKTAAWSLLGLQILSAVLVGALLPFKSSNQCNPDSETEITLPAAVEESVKTMGVICGWIILFRLLLEYSDQWILCYTSDVFRSVIAGILELSNGCISLMNLESAGLRFIISSFILSAGGLCIAMQTISVTKQIGKSLYFPGKVLQSCISVLLASSAQCFIFPKEQRYSVPGYIPISCIVVITTILIILYRKKSGNS